MGQDFELYTHHPQLKPQSLLSCSPQVQKHKGWPQDPVAEKVRRLFLKSGWESKKVFPKKSPEEGVSQKQQSQQDQAQQAQTCLPRPKQQGATIPGLCMWAEVTLSRQREQRKAFFPQVWQGTFKNSVG